MQGPMQGPMQDRILHGLRQRVAATTDGTSMPLVDDSAEGPMAGVKTRTVAGAADEHALNR